MSNTPHLVTADELLRYPEDDFRYELVDGHVVRMSPVGYEHGRVVMLLGSRLERHVRPQRLGVVLTEVGFTLSRDPDTVRAPDIAFIRAERLQGLAPPVLHSNLDDTIDLADVLSGFQCTVRDVFE